MKTSILSLLLLSASAMAAVQARACEAEETQAAAGETGKPFLTLVQSAHADQAPGVEKATFQVKGMTCRSCEKSITRSLKKVEGVQEVVFRKKDSQGLRLAEVSYAAGGKVTTAQLLKAVQDAGYEATSVQ